MADQRIYTEAAAEGCDQTFGHVLVRFVPMDAHRSGVGEGQLSDAERRPSDDPHGRLRRGWQVRGRRPGARSEAQEGDGARPGAGDVSPGLAYFLESIPRPTSPRGTEMPPTQALAVLDYLRGNPLRIEPAGLSADLA